MLPGEPLSPAQSNAAAKVATIAGAYQVHRWTLSRCSSILKDWSELNPEQLEFLSDYSLEREDCSRDAIEDALWQFVRYENLSAEVSSGWYVAGSEPGEPPAGASGSASAVPAATSKATSATPASMRWKLSAPGLVQTALQHRLTWSVKPWNGSRRSSWPDGASRSAEQHSLRSCRPW